jgi:hypothetical protein
VLRHRQGLLAQRAMDVIEARLGFGQHVAHGVAQARTAALAVIIAVGMAAAVTRG